MITNIVDPDQRPHHVAGLHCLPMPFYGFPGKNWSKFTSQLLVLKFFQTNRYNLMDSISIISYFVSLPGWVNSQQQKSAPQKGRVLLSAAALSLGMHQYMWLGKGR